jgi:hypothetical protein
MPVFRLVIIFTSFGLYAPRNATVMSSIVRNGLGPHEHERDNRALNTTATSIGR